MNFTNYLPLYSMYYTLPLSLPPYQYVEMYMPNNFNQPVAAPEPPVSAQQAKKQLSFDQINFESVEQQLRKLHFEQKHHKKTHWSIEEDKILERLVEIQKLEWKDIPKYFEGRTQNMCYSRYRRISMSTKDRAWTIDQEELVLGLVSKFGQKWKLISQKIPKFTPKQIRQRYLNYLRPNINKQNFTLHQDLKICEYVLNHGKHWRKMEQSFPNRSEGIIKERYYGKLKEIIENSVKNDY